MRTYPRPERVVDAAPRRGNVLAAVSGEFVVREWPDMWPEGTDVTAAPDHPDWLPQDRQKGPASK